MSDHPHHDEHHVCTADAALRASRVALDATQRIYPEVAVFALVITLASDGECGSSCIIGPDGMTPEAVAEIIAEHAAAGIARMTRAAAT